MSFTSIADGTLLSLSADNVLRAWDSANNYSFLCERVVPLTYGSVTYMCPMCPGHPSGEVLVATSECLLQGSMQQRFRTMCEMHRGVVHALATHPAQHAFVASAAQHAFVASGMDRVVCKWSAVGHRLVWKAPTHVFIHFTSFT